MADGAVTAADVQSALTDQSSGEPARLGDLLVAMGKINTHQLAKALATQHGVPFTELPPIPSAILELVPMEFQRQFRFVPLKVGKGSISIAMADLAHANAEVLPLLRRRFPTVQIFIAPSDAIDAVHAAVTGEYESPSNVALPSVAPAIAPVISAPPAPAPEDLFESIEIDLPPDEPPPGPNQAGGSEAAFELEEAPVSPAASFPAPVPFVFEATATGLLTTPPPSARPGPPRSQEGQGEDVPFFEAAPRARPIAKVDDRAFVPGVPMSSPSSLAKLVIEPELAPIAIVPAPDLKVTMTRTSAIQSRTAPIPQPPAIAPPSPSRITLPEWIEPEVKPAGEGEGWSGALDALAPSKLILAVTKALLKRGLLTEQEIIDSSELKK